MTALFVERGARVAAVYHSRAELPEGTSLALQGDVGDEADVERLLAVVHDQLGGPDILLNLVGGWAGGQHLADLDLAVWERMLDLNLKSVFLCSKQALRYMLPAGYGRIVNVASKTAFDLSPGVAAYAVAKAGVVALTTCLAHELKGSGVAASCVAPGTIDRVLPGFFAGAMDMAERYPQAGVIMGKAVVADAAGQELAVAGVRRWREPLYASPRRFLREYLNVEYVGHSLTCASVFRRVALAEIGFFRPELETWSDTFALRALALRHGACYVPERWATWRVVTGSYGSLVRLDMQRTFAVAARSAALMRAPEFADCFPEAYVRRWKLDMDRSRRSSAGAARSPPSAPGVQWTQTSPDVREGTAEGGASRVSPGGGGSLRRARSRCSEDGRGRAPACGAGC